MGQIDTIKVDGTNYDVADKRLTECAVASDGKFFLAASDSNNPEISRMSHEDAAKVMSVQESLGGANDNVFIMFHGKIDNYTLMVKPDKWASYQNSGEVATGVAVVDGERILVVAPSETSAYWSSAAVSAGGKTAPDRPTALGDFEGKASTASQITHSEASGASYAPGYCAQYSRTNANGQGLTAGSWWLPSLGELMMIYANKDKINYALSLISGATKLSENWYWSSTEYSNTSAWVLYLSNGFATNHTKATNQGRVRAVSSISLNLPSFYKDYATMKELEQGTRDANEVLFPYQEKADFYYKINFVLSAAKYGLSVFVANLYCAYSQDRVFNYTITFSKYGDTNLYKVTSDCPTNLRFFYNENKELFILSKYGGNIRILSITGKVTRVENIGTTPPEGLTEIPLSNGYVSYMKNYPDIASLSKGVGGLQKSIYQNGGAVENVKITLASKEKGDYADVYVYDYGSFGGNEGSMHKILVDKTGAISITPIISNGTTSLTKLDDDSVSVPLLEYSMLVVYSNMDITIQKL